MPKYLKGTSLYTPNKVVVDLPSKDGWVPICCEQETNPISDLKYEYNCEKCGSFYMGPLL